MSLVRFDVTREIEDLRREVNRVFAGAPLLGGMPLGEGIVTGTGRWLPEMDTVEEDGVLRVMLDLPGLAESDIDVEVHQNVLTIRGTREIERREEGQEWLRLERSSGEFERSLLLPDGIDADAVTASFEHGVLTVRVPLPVAVGSGARHVEITAGATE